MKKRTIRIDGIKLGYKHGFDLYELIKDQIDHYASRQEKPKMNLIYIAKCIEEFLAQWDNVEFGDIVEFKPSVLVLNLKDTEPKPEPKIKIKKLKQAEFNFN